MLQVHALCCTSAATCTSAFLRLLVTETEKLDLAMLSFCTNGTKVWVALVCRFFDHHMQVATEMQLR